VRRTGRGGFHPPESRRQEVKLHQEPGTDTDDIGNLWRYISYSVRADSRTGLPVYAQDVGYELVMAGWATPRGGGENADYMGRLTSVADIASHQPEGMYAPPCGKPKVYGDDNGNGIPDYDDHVEVDVDTPDPDPAPAPRRERTGRSGHP
jgi:hypothetical protein